ncbi:MAG TPA: flagellar assembly peptidoglycan hydrolase FlgJ [Burkholderiaceae bacterium]|nr:flagellar assembly peptidoglycan hydrolase FlgJ [Burkholderiaceae bacterium]
MSTTQSIPAGLALDARSLDGLRRDAAHDPQAAVRKAAGQFEALFMQQLLKSMRDAMPKSGMFQGPGHDTYVGMLDQQLSQSMAGRPGGLADMIAKQLSRHMAPAEDAASRTPANDGQMQAGPHPGHPAAFAWSREQRSAAHGSPSTASRPASPTSQPSPSLDPAASARLKASLARRLDGPQAAFVDRMWPHALAAQRATGVPAAFVVGQAALESGWGRHEIRHADGRSAHNLFGIKATGGWKGATVDVATTEYVDGQPRRMVERFRAYDSYADAFRDWATLMADSPRYGAVLRAGQSVEGFAQGMQRAGYATDPRYGSKLENTINQTLLLQRLVT